jgi:nicotinamide mononucleotide (NMN) deamidase PncC
VSGIAGPDGGTTDKPVGTVWFAVCGPSGHASVVKDFLGSSRDAVRARATSFGLDLIRRQVFGLAVIPS